MKRVLTLGCMLLMFSCQSKRESESKETFDWLLGKWVRTNEEAGKSTLENWSKLNDSTYLGNSYTLVEKDTVWSENTVFSTLNGVWQLQVKLKGETNSTNFKVIESDSVSFKCENQQNEFPKIISYRKGDGQLLAEISDDSTKIEFIFEPKL